MFQSIESNKMSFEGNKLTHPQNMRKRRFRKMIRQMKKKNVSSTEMYEGQNGGKFVLNPSKLSGVLPSESNTIFGSAPPKLENSLETINQMNFQQAGSRVGYDFRTQNNTRTGLPSSDPLEKETESKCQFPELIIFRGCGKGAKALSFLKNSFRESPYGPLSLRVDKCGLMFKCSLCWNNLCLAEGEGETKQEADAVAVTHLYKKLRTTNYVIEVKRTYIPRHVLPPHVLHVDPSNSHIFKVVCLRKPDGPDFPNLSGAVDYVSSELQLWRYVENHAKSHSKADIFVLNIEREDRKIAADICRQQGMSARNLPGCSDRGVVASRRENLKELLEDLLDCGGETIKYHLIPPGRETENINIKEECDDEDENYGNQQQNAQKQKKLGEEEEIKISQWISDNLILMDYFNGTSQLETARELLFLSVKFNSDLDEFIIEKTYDELTGKITARAKIDNHVVGIAKGFNVAAVKKNAAEDALKNLRKCCYYVEGKKSYFGYNGDFPEFLKTGTGEDNNKIYRIAHPGEGALHKCLQRFRTSPVQDLFFLENIPFNKREEVCKMANQMGFLVRTFGRKCVCVQKSRNPRQIYKELQSTMRKENEKYKLHIPPTKLGQQLIGSDNNPVERKIQTLFDIDQRDVKQVLNKEIPSTLNRRFQNQAEKMVPTVNRSDGCSWNKQNNIQGDFKNSSFGTAEQSLLYIKGNKRSFDQGPGDRALLGPVQVQKLSIHQSNPAWESTKGFVDQRFVDERSWKEKKTDISMSFNRGKKIESSQEIQTSSTNNEKPYDYEEDIWLEGEPEESHSSVSAAECAKSHWQTDQAWNESQHTALTQKFQRDVNDLGTQSTQSRDKDQYSGCQSDADSCYGRKSRFSAPTNYGESNQQNKQPFIKDTQLYDRKTGSFTKKEHIVLGQSSISTNYQEHPSAKDNHSYYQENQQYGWEKKGAPILPSLYSENVYSRESNQQTQQSWSEKNSDREPYGSGLKLSPNTINKSLNVRESNQDQQCTRVLEYGHGSLPLRGNEPVSTDASGKNIDSAWFNRQSADSSVRKLFDLAPNIREFQKNIDMLTSQYDNRLPCSDEGKSDFRVSNQIQQSWNRIDSTSNQYFDVKSSVREEKKRPPQNPFNWMNKERENPTFNPVGREQFSQQSSQTLNRDMESYYHGSREKDIVITDTFDKRAEKNEPSQCRERHISQLFDLGPNNHKSQQQTNELISKDNCPGGDKFGSSTVRAFDFREPSKHVGKDCNRTDKVKSFGRPNTVSDKQTTSQGMSLSRDNRWSSDNRQGSWRDKSNLNQQMEQTWDTRNINLSSGQRPINERTEKERSFNQFIRGSESQSGQLWNKDNKRFYDQRPESGKESQVDFPQHFSVDSSKDFSQRTLDTPSSRWKPKMRGHSFNKMNKYVLNVKKK